MSKRRPELDLRQFLPYRLYRLGERLSEALAKVYSGRYGLSVPEWRTLAWLSHLQPQTATAISRNANVDKSTVSRALQRLAERGLISRAPSPEDNRVQLLALTEAGEELLRELLPLARAWEAELIDTLTARELRDLWLLIDRLERRLEEMESGGGVIPPPSDQ